MFLYFFKPQRLKYQFLAFPVHDVIKTFSGTFSSYFFKPKRLKYQELAFLVHDVIKHFPVLIQITTYEILVTCFSSTWHSKTFPRSFSGTFFKLQRLIYQLLAVLVHDVLEIPPLIPVIFQTTMFEISAC